MPAGNEPARPQPGLFIFDERFPDAVALSRQAILDGVRLASTRDVFTNLWYAELDMGWRRTPGIVAGATTDRTLHILETLALDRQMRVTDRTVIGGDGLVCWTLGPAPRHRASQKVTGA